MSSPDTESARYALSMRVARQIVVVNLLLSAGKLAAGLIAHSGAMISDAVNSISDIFSTLMVMVGLKLSGRAADQDHEYGHERLECIVAILLSALIAVTGCALGWAGVQNILAAQEGTLAVPGLLALWAAAASIAVKEGMYHYTRRAARKSGSSSLMAVAWDHRSDALSSLGGLIGIAGARLGYPVLDPVASLVICLFILRAAVNIFRGAVEQLTDHAASPELEEEMRTSILHQPGVLGLDLLKTRQFGARIYVDVEIAADGSLSLVAAHGIAQQVHDEIERSFPSVKHCMVHVNPAREGET